MAKKHLVIVESPAKAKTIGKYLGRSYTVKASMGHLRDLPKSKMGVDLEHDFEPDYQPLASKAAIISELRSASKAAKHIYLATDPDREGEAISWHLKELLELPELFPQPASMLVTIRLASNTDTIFFFILFLLYFAAFSGSEIR